MKWIGDFAEDATVYIFFTTHDASGGAVAPSSAFEAADVDIYKNNSATQKTSTNGVTMTSPFDGTTGLHLLAIDTSNDTGDAGFWATGTDYTVVLTPDETVASQTVVSVLAQFSIENRYLTTSGIATAVMASVIENSLDLTEVMRLVLAASAGKVNGAATTTVNIRDTADTKNRIQATVDADGNRTAVTLDAS